MAIATAPSAWISSIETAAKWSNLQPLSAVTVAVRGMPDKHSTPRHNPCLVEASTDKTCGSAPGRADDSCTVPDSKT